MFKYDFVFIELKPIGNYLDWSPNILAHSKWFCAYTSNRILINFMVIIMIHEWDTHELNTAYLSTHTQTHEREYYHIELTVKTTWQPFLFFLNKKTHLFLLNDGVLGSRNTSWYNIRAQGRILWHHLSSQLYFHLNTVDLDFRFFILSEWCF